MRLITLRHIYPLLLVACVSSDAPDSVVLGVDPDVADTAQDTRITITGEDLLPRVVSNLETQELVVDTTFAMRLVGSDGSVITLDPVEYFDSTVLATNVPAGTATGSYTAELEGPHGLVGGLVMFRVYSDLDDDGVYDDMDDCVDLDGDGLGRSPFDTAGCDDPAFDTDDTDPSVCGDVDVDGCEDCSSNTFDTNNDGVDADGDGVCAANDCDDANLRCSDDCTDADNDGVAVCAGDCDDDVNTGTSCFSVTLDAGGATATQGGPGGGLNTDACPADEFLIGFSGQLLSAGSYHENIAGNCGSASIVFQGGSATITVTASGVLPTRGSPGGSDWVRNCPAGHVLTGFGGRNAVLVDQLTFRCAPLQAAEEANGDVSITLGAPVDLSSIGSNGGVAFPQSDCPNTQAASVQVTRTGESLDNFGLSCSVLSVP